MVWGEERPGGTANCGDVNVRVTVDQGNGRAVVQDDLPFETAIRQCAVFDVCPLTGNQDLSAHPPSVGR